MPASEAQVRANQANAARSTGPKTPEGKERSRANALKHGLTGAGIVLPNEDAAEVERMVEGIQAELAPSGEIGHALARRAATLAVRMDRCVAQEAAALSSRVRRAMAEFEAPAGTDPAEAERLRAEAGRLAMFDPSKEASLARQYEVAAERGFFRAIKELRQLAREEPPTPKVAEAATQAQASLDQLASFFPGRAAAISAPSKPLPTPPPAAGDRFAATHFDVPIAIGRRR